MTQIACGHCRAPKSYLQPLIEHLEEGAALQTVRCVACGWRVSRTVRPHVYNDPGRDHDNGPQSRQHLSALRNSERQKVARENALRRVQRLSAPCALAGCTENYYRPTSKYSLCSEHGRTYGRWLRGELGGPVPYLPQPDGSFIVNPERRSQS